jgi:hypothetical protein
MTKLLSNLPIENLTKENDYIGIIEKGDLIKSFFLGNKQEFAQIKFFSIYGDWGSGKSTLMKYLEKELKTSFNPFFFEAWQFESDANLANSLLEFLDKKSGNKVDDFLKNGRKLLDGFSKSVTFKTPFANFNMGTMTEEVNKQTFLELKEQFSKDFIDWENKMTSGVKDPNYNIVFIDDLDRCEPDNVLNLLSAIKLFFTFGKKTIFFCGIDKKAVKEAVKTKYGEVVKANEYLEKVFDVSFSMPQSTDVSKLVNQYFDDSETVGEEKLRGLVNQFFKKIHFQNPRRIKKILNKYLIIKRLKESDSSESLTLPNIMHEGSGTLFETYLTLYLLILNEFEPEEFELVFDLSVKRVNYREALKENYTIETSSYRDAAASTIDVLKDDSLKLKVKDIEVSYRNSNLPLILVPLFAPIKVDNLTGGVFSKSDEFVLGFSVKKKTISYYFTIFILDNWRGVYSDFNKINFSLLEYKKMVSNLL